MSGEKKHWRLSTPFRRLSGTQDSRPTVNVGRSRSHVSNVYLSDDSSTSGFIVKPEFDYPVQTHKELKLGPILPAVTSSGPSSHSTIDSYPTNFEPIASQYSYLCGGSPIVNTGRDNDLAQRLRFAYEHIRSMPSTASPKVSLSSDPQLLRKQLGVPQHSVFNHPVHSSPDLPNPHTSHESVSAEFSTTPSPDVSHARTSQKLCLSIDMDSNIYSSSPLHRFQDSIHPQQNNSASNTPILTENSSSQCRPLETFSSSHITCTSKPQPSIPKSSKLVKQRVEKPTISPTPLPSFNRHASRGILRTSCADTRPSANTHRRQISLPQIKPPSPFNVDIPLHHAWHDRRTEFNSSIEHDPKIFQLRETNTRRTSGSTEVLASLVWIGTPYIAHRRRHSASPAFLPDRFSMGIAEEDEGMSDDVLVDRLEKVRRISDPEWVSDVSPSRSSSNAHFSGAGGDENALPPTSCLPSSPSIRNQYKPFDVPFPSPSLSKDATPDLEDAAVWRAARKALLCIREIVRTEKRYQEALRMLLNAQTTTPPPPSMVPYVLPLVQVSEMLLKHFLEDPSAWGVSTAFVTSEDELEATMVSWCAAAGTFFTDGDGPRSNSSTGRWRLRKSGVMSGSSSSVTKRTSISLSPQLPPMLSVISAAGKIKERIVDEFGTGQHPQSQAEKRTNSVSPQNPESTTGQSPSRKLSVRDLAIQPIQRVMRYVLLYRDLLNCTPVTSPPRLLVERAVEAATRIANHCDRAQRNPAFCHAS